MRHLPILLFVVLAAMSCKISKKATDAGQDKLSLLTNYMTGSFNSADQAMRDTNFFDITLHMYPIWKNREGSWLYVEQAVTSNQAKPYRQRIYRLEQIGPLDFVSSVYTIKNEKDFVGAWNTPDRFNVLTLDGIELKQGCEVVLHWYEEGRFSGSTGHKTCPSDLRGASYTTSKVTVFPDKITSWDQGFNYLGEQVWGATTGGYEFVKQKGG